MKSWTPPDLGQLKVNYDVAVCNGTLVFAALIRNSQGHILHAQAGKTVLGNNPIKGGARAARLACDCALCFEGTPLIIEGDCLDLVTQIHDRDSLSDWEIAGEVDSIRGLLDIHSDWSFTWARRDANAAAHSLARWCSRQQNYGVRPQILPIDTMPLALACWFKCNWLFAYKKEKEKEKRRIS
ncbi:hypothetical protein CJ030_MR8G020182 [Morella rubra]|uniref:RNase H type-1 domain-containing protein n=1 Tax=Morella rubra TaxID=262757 RepID=A0A6A1UPQ7_9ROSI|nr:hypothetical protein CJ030_MR8G020182 [Morella rubra]